MTLGLLAWRGATGGTVVFARLSPAVSSRYEMKLDINYGDLVGLDNAGAPEEYPETPQLLARGVFVVERPDVGNKNWCILLLAECDPIGEIVRLTFDDISLERWRGCERPTRLSLQGDRLVATSTYNETFVFRPLVPEDSMWIAGRKLDLRRLLDAIAGTGEFARAEE